jgi:hypothetical protein
LRLNGGRPHRNRYGKRDRQRMAKLLPQPCAACLQRPRCVAHKYSSRKNAGSTNPIGQRFAPSSAGGSIGRAHGVLANAARCCSAATGQFLKSIRCF